MEKPHFGTGSLEESDFVKLQREKVERERIAAQTDGGPSKLSRRGLLLGMLGVAAGNALYRTLKDKTHDKKDSRRFHEGKIEDHRSPEFIQALASVERKVTEIEKNSVVLRSKKAKEALSKTPLPANGEGIALYFSSVNEPDDALALEKVDKMRNFLHDRKIREYRVTTKEEDLTKRKLYGIKVSDMYKDIGVSSRLSVEEIAKDTKKKKTVLAVKRARYDQGEKGYGEYITYTPAHADLRTNEVIKSGVEYIDTVVDEAEKLFKAKDIRPNILKLSTEVAKRVAVIEHIDPYEFYNKNKDTKKGLKDLYDISLAEYSLNLGTAYNHLINSVGAGGMMQIIPKTYRDVRARIIERGWFKEEDLPKDIDEGRKSPLVSAIISIALSYLNYELKQKLLTALGEDDRLLVLASMYNGSPNLLHKILGADNTSKVLRGGKNQKEKASKKESYRSVREKLLENGKGNMLAGTNETENENYMQKFITYDSFVTRKTQ